MLQSGIREKAVVPLCASTEVHSNPPSSSLHPLHLRHIRFLYILHEGMGESVWGLSYFYQSLCSFSSLS